MPTRLDFDLQFGAAGRPAAFRKGLQGVARILIMGDLSGRRLPTDRPPAAGGAAVKTIAVDVDNLESVFSRLAPRLVSEGGPSPGTPATIAFASLDDFHPDSLYRKLPMFEPLRTMRARLLDPATAAAAVAELASSSTVKPDPGVAPPAGPPRQPGENAENDQAMLERLLGARPVSVARSAAALAGERVNLDRFLHDLVAPHIVRGAPPEQRKMIASIDAASGALMRAVLHDRSFQSLEATWRSIHRLVTELETGEELEIHLLDLPFEKLETEIAAAAVDPASSSLYRLLVEESRGEPGERPWTLLIGDYRFGTGERDLRLLGALGAIASRAGAPLIAAAEAEILGCASLHDSPDPRNWKPLEPGAADRWSAVRASSGAGWLGLVLPRILLRLPYGRDTDEIEAFTFEESSGGAPGHEDYLWGNPAFACARLIGESFAAAGAAMQPGDHLDLGDLPAHTRPTDDGPALQACAEVYLPERAAEAMLERGIMPLMSFRNRNMARLVRFQSIADPPGPLMGPWTE